MKKLKTTLVALLLAASQWTIGQSGSNCPDAIPQTVQEPSLAMIDTLSFDGVGSELWLEFQAPADGLGVIIDYRMKPGLGGTEVIAIEVYQQMGGCANLQLVDSKSLAIDSTVLIELDSTAAHAFYTIKLTKDSADSRNNDIIGSILKSLQFGICWQNITQGTSGYCFQYDANGNPTETTYYDQWGNPFDYQSCIINACVGDVLCYSGFSYDPVAPSVNCPNYPFQLDNWWYVQGSDEFNALPLGQYYINYPTVNNSYCVTYNTPGDFDIGFMNQEIPGFNPQNSMGYFFSSILVHENEPTILSLFSEPSACQDAPYVVCIEFSGIPVDIIDPFLPIFDLTLNGQTIPLSGNPTLGLNVNGNYSMCFELYNPSSNIYNIIPGVQNSFSINGLSQTNCQTNTSVSGTFEITPLFDWIATPTNCSLSVFLENLGCYTSEFNNSNICFDMGDGTGLNPLNCTGENYFGYNYSNPGTYTIDIYYLGDLIETLTVTVVGELSATEISSEYLTKCCIYDAEYAVPNNYVSYTWTVIDGTITSGQGTNIITVDWDAQAPGSFVYVTVVDANGCEATAELYVDRCCEFFGTNFPNTIAIETDHCAPTVLSSLTSVANVTTAAAIIINNDLIIDYDFSFITCPNIFIRPGAKIIVAPNVHFQISNNTRLKPFCDQPWEGIHVTDNSAKVTIDKGSYVIGAYNAVYSENGGEYLIINSFLLNNETGIRVVNSPNLNPSTIYSTVISTVTSLPNIPNVFANRGKYGVYIENVQNLTIGVTTSVAGSNINTFNDLDFGVYASNSNINVFRNHFSNLTNNPSTGDWTTNGIGVYDQFRSRNDSRNLTLGITNNGNANTFDNCNVGLYVLGEINVSAEYNVMNNSHLAGMVLRSSRFNTHNINGNRIYVSEKFSVGIYLWGIHGSTATITYNFIDRQNTGQYALTNDFYQVGIVTTSIGVGSTNTVTINSNTVRNTRFGINADLINPLKVFNNTIVFQDNFNMFDNVYGIYAGGCGNGQIYTNIVQRNGAPPSNGNPKLNFVGIQIENSPNVYVHKNDLRMVGKGLQARGNNDQSKIQCNTFNNNFNGVFLESTVVGNQGIPSAPQDNKWISNGGQFKIEGDGNNIASNWYYRNIGVFSINPYNLPATSINANMLPPMIQNSGCVNNPIGPVGNGPKSLLRPIIFDPIVYDTKTFSVYDSTMKFIDRIYARMSFMQDTTWLTVGAANDADYSTYYQATNATNLGMFCRIAKAYEEDDMAVLAANNTGLNTTTCTFSSDLKEVNAIYTDTWGQGIYQFTPQQQTRLEELSCRDAAEFGPSVYAARALLGEFLFCNNGYEKSSTPHTEENSSVEGSALVQDVTISVYPNPTEGEAYLFYEIGDRQTAVVNVYDLTGKLVAVTPLTSNTGVVTLNLSELDSGVYLFQVLSDGQLLSTGRIIRN